jgi:hypothetical protein
MFLFLGRVIVLTEEQFKEEAAAREAKRLRAAQ